MSESLFSQFWYRVAPLKPQLGSHVQIHRHSYRGQDWFILQDHFTGRHHRFSLEAYQVIGLMDGRRSLAEIWETACARLGDHMPTQDEVINLLSQLHRSDLLQAGALPDFADLQKRRRQNQQSRLLMNLRSPMSVRFPLFDPDRMINRTMPLVRPFLGGFGGLIWLLVVGSAVVLAGLHWGDLADNINDHVLSLQNLALIGLIYPVVKIFHEFGHAYMVKRFGGEVHEMGVLFLVLMPIPYVDASTSLSFRDKRQRMLVGAAGILVELFLAGLAMLIWVNVEPGAVRATAFNLMLIAGISTLLFNGNPLLRYDAHYVLSDYLEIPNLGTRGNKYIGYLLQRYLLGIKEVESPATTAGEARWLGVYAVAAFFYRILISIRIILFIAGKFFAIGILLALWSGFSMVVVPLQRIVSFLFKDRLMQRRRFRLIAVTLLPLAGLIGVIFLLPVPLYTTAQGVIWAPEESRVYAAADGFVSNVLVDSGSRVAVGTPLLRCKDPELMVQVKILAAQLEELQARFRLSRMKDRTKMEILKDEIAQVEAELVRARERAADLLVRSSSAGIFVLPQQSDLPGRFVRRGDALGYVLNQQQIRVRVLVPQADIDRVRAATRKVSVRLAERIGQELPARIVRQVPAATRELPSLALSLKGGGLFALDPTQEGKMQVFERLFQLDLLLRDPLVDKVGERVYVRFEHAPEPLVYRWYRALRGLLLSRFDI
ncbi:MAG: HlyD family efflux transporter periplasmic adaptor subunit [Deltaproteobacteria bacterium]|nr:HlyD family efflux transporter periplasmic adaptor subunit [Deltaproteobacteria bacterium]